MFPAADLTVFLSGGCLHRIAVPHSLNCRLMMRCRLVSILDSSSFGSITLFRCTIGLSRPSLISSSLLLCASYDLTRLALWYRGYIWWLKASLMLLYRKVSMVMRYSIIVG